MMESGVLIFLLKIVGAIVIAFLGITIGLFYKGLDRKIAAKMQSRIGPPIRQTIL